MRRRSVWLVAAGVVGVGAVAVVVGAAAAAIGEFDDGFVVSVDVGRISVMSDPEGVTPDDPVARSVAPDAPSVSVPSSAAAGLVVPGLVERVGVLTLVDDDWYLGSLELDAGPGRWLRATPAAGDVDGDGTSESWWDELAGSVGRTLTVLGQTDDDDIDAYEIEGMALRPLHVDVEPWSDDWTGRELDGPVAELLAEGITAEDAVAIAVAEIPGVVTDVSIDVNDGRPYWEVDVRSVDGDRYDIEIDALSGTVIEVDRH